MHADIPRLGRAKHFAIVWKPFLGGFPSLRERGAAAGEEFARLAAERRLIDADDPTFLENSVSRPGNHRGSCGLGGEGNRTPNLCTMRVTSAL
jgi:hypothetical protein